MKPWGIPNTYDLEVINLLKKPELAADAQIIATPTLVKKCTAQLEQKKQQMQALNKQFVGRELRMIELQEEIARLQSE